MKLRPAVLIDLSKDTQLISANPDLELRYSVLQEEVERTLSPELKAWI